MRRGNQIQGSYIQSGDTVPDVAKSDLVSPKYWGPEVEIPSTRTVQRYKVQGICTAHSISLCEPNRQLTLYIVNAPVDLAFNAEYNIFAGWVQHSALLM